MKITPTLALFSAALACGTILLGARPEPPARQTIKPSPRAIRAPGPAALGGCLQDNGDTDGLGGRDNGVASVYGGRRALLDDFIVPPGDGWLIGELLHRHVWLTVPPGSGTGMEIIIRRDDGGAPGPIEVTANVISYSEVATGREFLGRDEALSRTEFDPIALGPGHYWFEAVILGPEENFWLTRDDVTHEESWVNYADLNGLESGTDRFGSAADLAWCLGGLVTAPPGTLSLEIPPGCQTEDQVEIELWMRNLSQNATGFQAFLVYDMTSLTYRGDLSVYTTLPFPLHIQATADAEVSPGRLRLDGSEEFDGPGGTDLDSLLARLVFDVSAECTTGDVAFDNSQPFASELSLEGVPFFTLVVDTGLFTLDNTPPVLDPCPDDVTIPADAGLGGGCQGAVYEYTPPAATDECGAATVECDPPSGSEFPIGTTTVTCTATDECGNTSTCDFDVTVTGLNAIDVALLLPGSLPATRCIHFITSTCGYATDVELDFVDHDADPSTAVRAVTTIEVPCGDLTILCAKDQQHTLWASSTLSLSRDGSRWVTDTPIALLAGDVDGDGDVDMDDTAVILAQFGGPEPDGGCPWNGRRGADLNNGGNVGSEDYSLHSATFGQSTTCTCSTVASWGGPPPTLRVSVPIDELDPRVAARVDVDRNGVFDVRDIERLEARFGLSGALSDRIRALGGR